MDSIIRRLQHSIAGGALIIGLASVCSRLLGLVRDRLLSSVIGTGDVLDSYFTAFKVPDFIFNLLVLGVMSASFVPVFIEYQKQKGKQEAMAIANSILNLLIIALTALAILVAIFAPQLVSIFAFGDDLMQQTLIVHFMRYMLISLVLFGMSNVLSGILHAHRQFFIYAIAPIFYNVGIIIGILCFVPVFGSIGLAMGVVLGALLHVIIQIPAVFKSGFRYAPVVLLRHPGVQRILTLMPPRAFALGLTQINLLIIFALASTLGEGTRSWWQFADNLQHFPINIFGVSLALAAFPVFSEAFAENNIDRFKKVFSENVRRILFFIIPISIVTLLLRAQIVRLVYGTGKFTWTDTFITAQVLGIFALSMFAQGLIPLLTRAFFAKQDTRTPVLMSSVAVVVNVLLGIILMRPFGIFGLAFAFTLSMIVQMVLLVITLRKRHGDLDDRHILFSTAKIIFASLMMGVVIQGLKYFIQEPLINMDTFVGVLTQTMIALIGGGVVYLIIAVQFQFEEAKAIWAKLKLVKKLVKR